MKDEMFVHYKRPSKSLKQRRRHIRAGGSIFDTVLVTGTTRTVNTQYETRCDACQKPYHDLQTCQSISLIRIADALEAIQDIKKKLK